ncbi:hypothetical protein RhiirA4_490085 [Rhizophagus irregularis]|uniref:Uncharacterized protein n=1 Tax=Rhizophagus irregularis TaxID=588596 RepID=A0A2I1HVC7_9GLOM|nr:hypothetical protein RhiirA4_490085 [Rhizophagus irregularis]
MDEYSFKLQRNWILKPAPNFETQIPSKDFENFFQKNIIINVNVFCQKSGFSSIPQDLWRARSLQVFDSWYSLSMPQPLSL